MGIGYVGACSGVAVGDFNGDGWVDIFDSHHHAAPSMYLNEKGICFAEVEVFASTGSAGDQHGAAWADSDNDGDLDLIILGGGGLELARARRPFFLIMTHKGLLRLLIFRQVKNKRVVAEPPCGWTLILMGI